MKHSDVLIITFSAGNSKKISAFFFKVLEYIYLFKAYWLLDAPAGLTFNNCTFCTLCIYVFCIYL
jgi:hypothetical protein